jgi:hypothetical protein
MQGIVLQFSDGQNIVAARLSQMDQGTSERSFAVTWRTIMFYSRTSKIPNELPVTIAKPSWRVRELEPSVRGPLDDLPCHDVRRQNGAHARRDHEARLLVRGIRLAWGSLLRDKFKLAPYGIC